MLRLRSVNQKRKLLDTGKLSKTKYIYYDLKSWPSPVAQTVKYLPAMQEIPVRSLGQEDPLEKGMATHSSILSRRIPWTEEPSSPWSHKELHTTEQLTLSLFFNYNRIADRHHHLHFTVEETESEEDILHSL